MVKIIYLVKSLLFYKIKKRGMDFFEIFVIIIIFRSNLMKFEAVEFPCQEELTIESSWYSDVFDEKFKVTATIRKVGNKFIQ